MVIVTDDEKAKQTVKDSVFTDLFGNSKYLFRLYQSLHPEDTAVKESDLKAASLENIFTDGISDTNCFKIVEERKSVMI